VNLPAGGQLDHVDPLAALDMNAGILPAADRAEVLATALRARTA
jgi:hypothetical protein